MSKLFSKRCARTFTPKEPITLSRPCRNVLSPSGLASAWPSWATPSITLLKDFWIPFARRRMPEPRFLVVRLGSLGDIVHTFPAVAALRESFPKGEIVWLTHPRWKALVESSELPTETWEVERRAFGPVRDILARIRKRQFTAAIDYQGLWKSATLPFLGRVPRRIGFSAHSIREFGVPLLYTDRIRTTQAHIADQNGELTLRAGARSGVGPFSLSVPSSQQESAMQCPQNLNIDRYLVLSPAGGWRSKCWPAERYGRLCKPIRENLGLPCILNQGPGDERS